MTTTEMQKVVSWWCAGGGGGTVEQQLAIGFALRTLDGRPPLTSKKLIAQCERKLAELHDVMERSQR